MICDSACVVTYSNFRRLESALLKLKSYGFDTSKSSIVSIGNSYQQEADTIGLYSIGNKTAFLGSQNIFWDRLQFLFSETALFLIPGFGPVFIAGPLVSLFISTSRGLAAVGGSGTLTATLYNLGIPKNSIIHYEAQLKSGRLLLICQGKAAGVESAHDILVNTETQDMTIHFS